MNRLSRLLSLAILVSLVCTTTQAADQAKINEAIARGAKYLATFASQPGYTGGEHGVGSAALSGLALLEANVPPSDPSVQNIANLIRSRLATENSTYNISLSILFLDRLGDKADILAIQMLGIRLYAGLTANGGWTYTTGAELGAGGILPGNFGGRGMGGPGIGQLEGAAGGPGQVGSPAALGAVGGGNPAGPGMMPPGIPVPPGGGRVPPGGGRAAPGQAQMPGLPGGPATPPQPDNGFPQPKPKNPRPDDGFPQPTQKQNPDNPASNEPNASRLLPAAAQYYLLVRNALRGGRSGGDGDNSNTQFGLIALWVASRHGVPAQDAFALIEARFLTTQNRASGGWGYTPVDRNATPSMTCAGLLGLAVGAARSAPAPRTIAPKKGSDDPFDNPGKKGGDVPDGRSRLEGARKVAVDAGLLALSQVVRTAAAQVRPQGQNPGIVPSGVLNQFVGLGNEFYLLWSIERVAMTYGLDTLGDIDWHNWGADILLPMQAASGAWDGASHYGPDVNTAFAVLFLTRSNFVKDLSARIRGSVRDPGKSELRGSNVPALFAPKSKEGSGGESAASTPGYEEEPKNDPIADGLVNATGPAWEAKLKAARDTKGGEQTAGLVRAIPLLDASRRKDAREALAERLTRMTPATLRKMLNDPNPELRRGAVLACGMKDDLDHVVDLIERIADSSDLVVRATRASLKSLTNQDFGPPNGASDEAKDQAKAAWVKWLKDQQQ